MTGIGRAHACTAVAERERAPVRHCSRTAHALLGPGWAAARISALVLPRMRVHTRVPFGAPTFWYTHVHPMHETLVASAMAMNATKHSSFQLSLANSNSDRKRTANLGQEYLHCLFWLIGSTCACYDPSLFDGLIAAALVRVHEPAQPGFRLRSAGTRSQPEDDQYEAVARGRVPFGGH